MDNYIQSYIEREAWLENQLDNMQSTHRICASTIEGLVNKYIADNDPTRHYLLALCRNLKEEAWRG